MSYRQNTPRFEKRDFLAQKRRLSEIQILDRNSVYPQEYPGDFQRQQFSLIRRLRNREPLRKKTFSHLNLLFLHCPPQIQRLVGASSTNAFQRDCGIGCFGECPRARSPSSKYLGWPLPSPIARELRRFATLELHPSFFVLLRLSSP